MSEPHPSACASPIGKGPPGEWALFAAIAAADVGIKLSYLPLFSILLPAKAQALGGASAPLLLSVMSLAGAALASVVNVVVGWRGDRAARASRVRWLGAGAAGLCGAYVLLALADTPATLLGAVLALQVAINVTISPLTALVAARFFRRPDGFVVGAGGVSQPAASFVGAALTGALLPFGSAAYLAVGLLAAALIAPFALMMAGADRRAAVATAAPAVESVAVATASHDLARLWIWRFSLALAGALSAPYALFRLREELGGVSAAALSRLILGLSALTLLSSCTHFAAAMATARAVSRGLHRRDAARLSALVVAAAMAAFATARGGGGFVLAFGLTGVGAGLNQVADSQLALGLLPSRATLGRDLGLLNLANTAPQMMAPLIAILLPGVGGGDVRPLFVLAALSSLAGFAVAAAMRSERPRGPQGG